MAGNTSVSITAGEYYLVTKESIEHLGPFSCYSHHIEPRVRIYAEGHSPEQVQNLLDSGRELLGI